ncbi:hypothetical protein PF010_g19661 [Phytophthora fragariae]|uniref:Uncharacterized protein n=1 Tax=Phytophthora fragariae TaxID=53985 RepID=A0A6G0KH58_9STRA|nr:hypothetical protein PF010_g19661 [Phytophthora fragariae]
MVKHEWPQLSEFRDHAVAGIVLPHTPAHDLLEEKIVRDAERTGLSNLSVPRRTSIFPAFSRRTSRAIQTVVTLGQGDLIPVTLVETTYRIVVQFFAGLWVTAILTAYTFFFTHKDANLTSNISTRLDQAVHFLLARKAPTQLVASVDTYFQYMQRTRNGVEEELIVAALPPHYRSQCSHYAKPCCNVEKQTKCSLWRAVK